VTNPASTQTPTPTVTEAPTSGTRVPYEPIVGAHLEHVMEKQASQWFFAPFDIAAAWTTSWMDYGTSLLRRRATPLDVMEDAVRFLGAATARPSSRWSTEHTVAREWPVARLLDFSTNSSSMLTPTLLLPPQAGHASTIVDYTPEQSQVRVAQAAGLTRLLVLEWLGATEETKNTGIEDYIAILDQVVADLGGRINLVGDCQGGWLAAIYAALRPESVVSLTIGAAPIDFHVGRAAIHDWVERFASQGDPMEVYQQLVESAGGVHRGSSQIAGFKLMEPAGEAERLADLWANIHDQAYVDRYLDFVSWFETGQDMPGAFYLWTVEHLFVGNELVRGELMVGGEQVDLGRITMPIYMLAGTTDHITPPEQVWALAQRAGTPAEDVHSRFIEAGHLGLFMGRRALRDHWSPIFAQVAAASVTKEPEVEASVTAHAAPEPSVSEPEAWEPQGAPADAEAEVEPEQAEPEQAQAEPEQAQAEPEPEQAQAEVEQDESAPVFVSESEDLQDASTEVSEPEQAPEVDNSETEVSEPEQAPEVDNSETEVSEPEPNPAAVAATIANKDPEDKVAPILEDQATDAPAKPKPARRTAKRTAGVRKAPARRNSPKPTSGDA
jgi:poly(3-hydroxybutyrate) depolymerase